MFKNRDPPIDDSLCWLGMATNQGNHANLGKDSMS